MDCTVEAEDKPLFQHLVDDAKALRDARAAVAPVLALEKVPEQMLEREALEDALEWPVQHLRPESSSSSATGLLES